MAVVVVDDFEAYDVQLDTSSLYEIRDQANNVVIEFGEGLAASAAIVANQHAVFGTSSGTTEFEGFVGIADFWGPGGPFGAFFSIPQDLTGSTVSADVRETTEAEGTEFRFLVADGSGEFVTSRFTLGPAFQTFNAGIGDFTIALDGGVLDPTNIDLVSLEFFSTSPPNAPVFSFGVDNVTINAPQGVLVPLPGALMLVISGLAGLVGCTQLSRKHRSRQASIH
jgi:hypothetical protein